MGLNKPTQRRTSRIGLLLTIIGVVACIASAVGLAVASTLLSESSADEHADLRTITYGLTLLPSGFDPHIHSSSELAIPLFSVYDPLIHRHPQTNAFVAGLAENWEISPDGLVYTFYLRQDVVFHDDTPFNAAAVAVTLDRVNDPTLNSRKARSLLGPSYAGYRIVDEYTIEINLTAPYAPLLDGLSQPYLGIASPTALANNNDATYQFHQVGTGPFEMVDFVPGDRIELVRDPNYAWGPPYYAPYTDQSVERVIFRFYEAPETRRIGLEAGDVDIVGELPPTDALQLLEDDDFAIVTQPIPGNPLQFYFNTQQFPTNDLRFRQGLLFSTNREAINGAIFLDQFSDAAYGPLSNATPYYSPTMQELYVYSLDEGERLFQQAGVGDSDDDTFLEMNNTDITLKIVFMGYGSLPEVAQLLESQWLELGLQVELIQVAGFADLQAVIESGDYHLVAFNEFSAEPTILNRYFASNGDRNWSGYVSDATLDEWLVQSTQTNNDSDRMRLYESIQRRIMDQALILPIRDYTNVIGVRSTIDGLAFARQGWWPLLTNLVLNNE